MGTFMGGSAWALAAQIGDGYILVSDRTWVRLDRADLEKLAFELDKLLRETRGNQPSLEDIQSIQQRNRKVSRLTGALSMLRSYQARAGVEALSGGLKPELLPGRRERV